MGIFTVLLRNQKNAQDDINANFEKLHPIGDIILNTLSSYDPNIDLGGTWERIKGKTLVGVDETDTDFTEGKTGGSKTHKLTINEIPKHTVPLGLNKGPNPSVSGTGTSGYLWGEVSGGKDSGSVGGDQAHNNLQPYIAVYMWVRTA